MSKIVKARSPKGKASWPKLFKPDTRFNPEGVYQTGLIVSKEDAAPFIQQIEEIFTNEHGAAKLAKASMPYKEDEDGNIVFSFKSKRKPMVVDSQGKPIEVELNVGSGSTIKVACGLNPYSVAGRVGVSAYLNAVQILDLVEYSSGGFDKEEGGFVAPDPEPEGVSKEKAVAEEDIDF